MSKQLSGRFMSCRDGFFLIISLEIMVTHVAVKGLVVEIKVLSVRFPEKEFGSYYK